MFEREKRAKQRKMREISDSQCKTAQNRSNLDAQKQRKNRAQKCTMHIPASNGQKQRSKAFKNRLCFNGNPSYIGTGVTQTQLVKNERFSYDH